MQNETIIDDVFGELLHAVDQFYNLPDKDDVSRTISIAKQSIFPSMKETDVQRAISYLNSLNFVKFPYCENVRSKIVKLLRVQLNEK